MLRSPLPGSTTSGTPAGPSPDRRRHPGRSVAAVALGLALTATACGGDPVLGTGTDAEADGIAVSGQLGAERFHPDGWAGVQDFPGLDLYDPVEAGEPLPDGFRQVLARDRIAPVYQPTFVTAEEIDWPDEELVIGVDLEGEARAYPVGFLNRREIVVDIHRGIPTFVTW